MITTGQLLYSICCIQGTVNEFVLHLLTHSILTDALRGVFITFSSFGTWGCGGSLKISHLPKVTVSARADCTGTQAF